MSKSGAHRAVLNAVKAGKLPHISTQQCQICNRGAHVYHHHTGYAKANYLDVVPLCQSCHWNEHGSEIAKLSDDEVRRARAMRKSGRTVKSIAREFGYDASNMGTILRGKSYKWVK